jgi:hypothetical protein
VAEATGLPADKRNGKRKQPTMRKTHTMPKRTDSEIEEAATRLEEWANTLTREDFEDAGDLRQIAETVDTIRASEARVHELMQLARARGRSWGEIGIALGVSRQAARERFSEKIRT